MQTSLAQATIPLELPPERLNIGSASWNIWAPRARTLDIVLLGPGPERIAIPMLAAGGGQFRLTLPEIAEGQRYVLRVNGHSEQPDPASRWQPEGADGPSAIVFPERFPWRDRRWAGVPRQDLVIYELHVGAFTPEGTFDAIIPRLDALHDLGITALELLPVAQFPGERSWGFDTVFPYAVQHSYGGPRGLQRLVNACHEAGLAVILDVPYYRLGPEAARLAALGPYTSNRAGSDSWAELNVDDDDGRHVREFVLGSLRQWVRDFHVDGLRLEAVPAFCDADRPRFLDEVRDAVRLEAEALGRHVHLIADSNLNDVRVLQPSQFGGYGLDAQWNNDFHHAVHALMTGERHGRYIDFGERDHLEKALNQTFVYDGCFSEHRRRSHGASADGLSGERFVISIQNHGEIGDRATGDRFGTMLHPGEQRLAAGLLLLAPYLPLIFMGQEYGETRRFPYFGSAGPQSAPADHGDARRRQSAPDPLAASTFESAKLAWSWPPDTWQEGLRELYADLLSARRSWPPLRDYVHRKAKFLGDKSSVLRLRRGDSARDRAYVLTAYFNFGNREEPLPRDDGGRVLLLSSESPRYAGTRTSDDRHDILLPFEFQVYLTNLADRR